MAVKIEKFEEVYRLVMKKLQVKELAKMLVRSEEVNEGDEGIDGEWYDFYVAHYICPDGGWAYDYEDAVLHTIDWLNADWSEEE